MNQIRRTFLTNAWFSILLLDWAWLYFWLVLKHFRLISRFYRSHQLPSHHSRRLILTRSNNNSCLLPFLLHALIVHHLLLFLLLLMILLRAVILLCRLRVAFSHEILMLRLNRHGTCLCLTRFRLRCFYICWVKLRRLSELTLCHHHFLWLSCSLSLLLNRSCDLCRSLLRAHRVRHAWLNPWLVCSRGDIILTRLVDRAGDQVARFCCEESLVLFDIADERACVASILSTPRSHGIRDVLGLHSLVATCPTLLRWFRNQDICLSAQSSREVAFRSRPRIELLAVRSGGSRSPGCESLILTSWRVAEHITLS